MQKATIEIRTLIEKAKHRGISLNELLKDGYTVPQIRGAIGNPIKLGEIVKTHERYYYAHFAPKANSRQWSGVPADVVYQVSYPSMRAAVIKATDRDDDEVDFMFLSEPVVFCITSMKPSGDFKYYDKATTLLVEEVDEQGYTIGEIQRHVVPSGHYLIIQTKS